MSENIHNTLTATMYKGKDFICAGFIHGQGGAAMGIGYEDERSPTLRAGQSCAVFGIGNGQANNTQMNDKMDALNCMHDQQCAFAIQGNCIDRSDTAGCNGKGCREEQMYTLNTVDRHAVGFCDRIRFILRRITPTECARLQGMPDWWCDDVPHTDSHEYKMWGNGIALPCALYIMEGLKGLEDERLQ